MKKAFKIILKIVLGLLALFLLIVLALQLSFVQNKVKDYAVTYLEGKIKTKVAIGSIEIGLPKKIVLNDFYFEEQSKDTLLAGKSIKVDIDLFQLMNNKVQINSIELDEIVANIKVSKDSVYNFDYIIDAFATADEPKKEEESPMEIALKKIDLNKVKFTYQDAVSKNDVALYITHFDTKIKSFDLNNLSFDIPDINLKGFKLDLNQDVVEATKNVAKDIEKKADTNVLKLKLDNIQLDDILIKYKSSVANIDTQFQLAHLGAKVESIDLEKQLIALNSIELNKTKGQLTLTKTAQKEAVVKEDTEKSESLPWNFTIDAISIADLNFAFDNNNEARAPKGINYNHMTLSGFNFKGEGFIIKDNSYKGKIASLQFKEQSGFEIETLKTDFVYGDKGASLNNLYLKTPQTTLQQSVVVTYPSIASLNDHLEELTINANLTDSKLAFKDVLLLVPTLSSNDVFKNHPSAVLKFDAVLKGRLDKLSIETFNASGLGNTVVSIKGAIAGLPEVETSIFNMTSLNLQSTAKDIYSFVPKNTIPTNLQLPNTFNVKGNFNGSMNTFKTNLDVKSSLGNAVLAATFDQSRKNSEKYIAEASVENFDLGKFIKNKEIGKITANAKIKGVSLNPAKATATFTSKVVRATYNQYTYKGINLSGSINSGLFDINASANDPNLTFKLDAKGSSVPEKPTVDLKLNAEIIDLDKLNLHAGPLKLKGNITANFDDLNVDNLNGVISINNFLVALEKEQFPLDSITITAVSNVQRDSIVLRSQFVDGVISGNYKLSTIANELQNSISKYYQFDKKYVTSKESQQLDFEFKIKDNPILKKLVPQVLELSEITLNGGYNSLNDSIAINALLPRINYASNEISNGVLDINTKGDSLNYNLSFGLIKSAQFEIPKTAIVGSLQNNEIDYNLNIKDTEDVDKYIVAGKFKDSLGASIVSFDPEKLLLNYDKWVVDANNYIKIAPKGILFSNFKIENGEQSFGIQSETDDITAPFVATFQNFEIKTLTSIAKSEFELGGKINGETTVKNLTTKPVFVSDLNIKNLTLKQDSIGDLELKVANKNKDIYTASVALTGLDNQLNVDGDYNVASENLDFVLDVQKLQMKSLQAFTMENLKDSEGFINGKLAITGKPATLDFNGNLKFNSVGFLVVPLNSKFKLSNDEIIFKGNKITFDNFKLQDENDNPLRVDGFIDSKDLTNVGFNLKVDAKNFRAVNSKATDNKLFYGELFLDNNLGIKGTMNSPIIDGTIKINEDTKFTIVLPQSDPSIADREGIVEFIDQDQTVLVEYVDPMKDIVQTELKGIDASVNIVVDKKAEISIVIDEANGDYLKLQGEAQLNGGIDPSGKTTLTGKYEFSGGAYEMNFNLIKRKFEIQPESYIQWTGEPTAANINITAVYKVDASPLDLVDDQLTGITTETRNTYKQKIPFETNLIMKGELLAPQISFDIVLPDGNNDVSTEIINTTQAKLTDLKRDEDALNKQVFALLLLNRFIGDNPFESEAGGTSGAYLAKQSVSKILSQQLNNVAGDLIKGFELDFDLEASEDYSSGERKERTDLNVGLSKQLFNDRLKVTLGSSFGVEGEQNTNEQATNIAGDVTADYLLTTDGRYKLRAYRKNNYQVALQGQVVETGVAFIITMNYNKFKELFQSKSKDKRKNNNKKPEDDENN
ncbi:translocation/assembly module TamB domain-containing protein [Flavobacterium algicola]|uniref:translocation/assembly module TamB domain-containing protein n=1 Tax=Flavobacterium algicola TaxID=556529 RepID=UPI001EFE04DC|nr:translocation/assembly module TamB domain-containing protein [Flavobacterium algicola]MCG9792607.1 translocation/assembly module TamB [Flavobacterium algicola]